MALTFVDFTADGNATKPFSFPSYQESDIVVEVDGVVKTVTTHYNLTNYTTTGGGQVVFTTNNIPVSPSLIRIKRKTDVTSDTGDYDPKATFQAGSSIKADDLNNNQKQALFAVGELQEQTIVTTKIKDQAVTTAKIFPDAVDGTKIADDSINSEHYVNLSIDTDHIADLQVTRPKIANDAVDGTKIADDSINSEHYVDGSIDTVHIGDSQIISSKIADLNVGEDKIADNAVTTNKILNSNVTTPKLATDAVTTIKITDGNVTTPKIANDAVITTKIADLNVTTPKIAADAIDGTKIADDSINSEHYVDGSIDEAHIADGQITTNKIAADAVTVGKIADGELKTLAGMQSGTASVLADSTALTASTAELNQLDGITLETTLTSSDTRIPTSKAVNDQILAVTNALGGFVAIANETSFPAANPDPSNGAGTVVSISQISSGTAVSVNNQGVATIANGAGTGNTVTITGFPSTLQNTNLAQNSGLQVQTTTTLHTYTFHKQLASADDIQAISATVNSFSNRYRVSSSAPTSSLDGGDLWYDTTNNKLMVYNSTDAAWEETTAIGNFFIATLSSSSGTGGGSATPNGTAYRFTLSNSAQSAQQLIVSVDGVLQKPNSGTSQPSEGYAIDGNDIIFGSAPVNGANIFITVVGSSVGIGTPSNNTVTSAILQNGSVISAKIAGDAVDGTKIADDSVDSEHFVDGSIDTAHIADQAVDLTKLPHGTSSNDGKFLRANNGADPSFETVNTDLVADTSPQLGGNLDLNSNNITGTGDISITGNISGTGNLSANALTTNAGNIIINSTSPTVSFVDSDANPDYEIKVNGGEFDIRDSTNNASKFKIDSSGEVISQTKLNCQAGLDTDGDVVFNTGTTNVNVTFDASTSNMQFSDSMSASFGSHSTTGDYSHVYVNGGDYTINAMSGGSGDLIIGRYENAAQKKHIVSTRAGVAELYHDNSKKLNTAAGGVTVTGTCTATAFAGDGSALTGITSFVSGMIIMYNSATAPSGWYLCDGNNGTPDLRDRFIVGAGNSYSLNATGGSNTATDTVSISGSDTVNISVSGTTGGPSATSPFLYNQAGVGASSSHSHSFSGSGSDTVNISGSDTVSIDTRSPYYALTFIMKA